MVVDEDGFINHKKVNKNRIEALEKYNWKNDIQFIILHRTASQNKKSTLNSFKTGIGTHFFVDTDGAIYQTATLNKTTSHIRNGYNSKTIGIEVQGKSLDEDGNFSLGRANEKSVVGWEEVSSIQAEGVACLLKGLLEHLKLDLASIKNHEDLQAKTAMEGGKVYNAIINLIK